MSLSRSAERTNPAEDALARAGEPARSAEAASLDLTADERSQIAARLRLGPSERLRYLEDMIAFEEQARRARRVT